jgi:hypothetical protein
MVANFQADFAQLLRDYNVSEKFQQYLASTDVGINSISDYIWAASNDPKQVDPVLIDPSGIEGKLKEKIAIRQSWAAAQIIFTRKADQQLAPAADQSVISEDDEGL